MMSRGGKPTPNRERAIEMRKTGMTSTEIAQVLGVSRERVRQYFVGTECAKHAPYYTPIRSIYPNLNKWMSERFKGIAWLVVEMGYKYSPSMSQYFSTRLRGKTDFKMSEIRKILNITGMTFEECFYTEAVTE